MLLAPEDVEAINYFLLISQWLLLLMAPIIDTLFLLRLPEGLQADKFLIFAIF